MRPRHRVERDGPEAVDVAVIGAGVVGAAIAREIGAQQLRCVLIEAGDDVGDATSKANTAILHTGFDAPVGSLEAGLVRRGTACCGEYAERTGIPVERTGAAVVAWTEEQAASSRACCPRPSPTATTRRS